MKLADTGYSVQDIKDKVSKYMIETYERFDFLAERAKDQYIYDEEGEEYLDFYAGIAVNSAGNCNEKVVEAVTDQVKDIIHTFNYPYTIPQALLAEKVCTTIGMDKIFFQNCGAIYYILYRLCQHFVSFHLQESDKAVLKNMIKRFFHKNDMRATFNDLQERPCRQAPHATLYQATVHIRIAVSADHKRRNPD